MTKFCLCTPTRILSGMRDGALVTSSPACGRYQRLCGATIGGLLLLFGVVAYTAVERHSPAYDEPIHAAANHVQRFYHDSRLAPYDPPVFSWLSTLPHRRGALRPDFEDPRFSRVLTDRKNAFPFMALMMYRNAGNDPERYLASSRLVFTAVGILIGILAAGWAWKLAGPAAGVIAATLFTFDPNFLAHGPLVCADVPVTLFFLSTAAAAWAFGRRGKLLRLLLLGLATGAAVNVKMSAVLLAPILVILFVWRAAMEEHWPILGLDFRSKSSKTVAALATVLAAGVIVWAMTWALYGFQFGATPDPSVRFGMEEPITTAKESIADLAQLHGATVVMPDQQPTPLFAKFVVHLYRWRVMPEAWLHGLLEQWCTTMSRRSFLLGERGIEGWWYYFPFSLLVKTPLAALLAALGALGAWIVKHAVQDTGEDGQPATNPAEKAGVSGIDRWDVACLLVPIAVYGFMSLRSSINIRIRHLFPIIPLLYILIAVVLAECLRRLRRSRPVAIGLGVLGVALAVETLAAYPSYLSFFNVAAGGSRGGLALLSDSSLDWGQGLKHLAAWQRKHPDETLYLCYFGSADPVYYGIRSQPLPNGYPYDPKDMANLGPGVLAISATHLQGQYLVWPPENPRAKFPKQEPMEVLDGCIYLYRWPPPPGEEGARNTPR